MSVRYVPSSLAQYVCLYASLAERITVEDNATSGLAAARSPPAGRPASALKVFLQRTPPLFALARFCSPFLSRLTIAD